VEWIGLGLVLLNLLGFGYYTYLVYRQLEAMQATNIRADANFRESERAWIGLHAVRPATIKDDIATFTLDFRNTGQTPAKARMKVSVVIANGPLTQKVIDEAEKFFPSREPSSLPARM
jgi:hypothetical protein